MAKLARRRTAYSCLLLLSTLFLGQNCGLGFSPDHVAGTLSVASVAQNSPLATPEITIAAAPASLTNSASADFVFKLKIDDRATVKSITCEVDSEPPVDCASGRLKLSNLSEGDHKVRIQAEDSLGQKAGDKVLQFRVDTIPPRLLVSQAPANIVGTTSALFAFAASDDVSLVDVVRCSLNGSTPAPCTSPTNLTGLSVGQHNFKIQAFDRAGNSGEVYTATWTVNLSAPTVSLSTNIDALTKSKTATFNFSGGTGGPTIASFECSLGGTSFTACTTPKTYADLPEGPQTFSVRGLVNANTVSAPATIKWLIDASAPAVPKVSADVGALTNSKNANLVFSATDTGSSIKGYACSLDGAAFAACNSPVSLSNLVDGNHAFRIIATDNAGNESSAGSFSWSVDSVPPTLVMSNGPADMTVSDSATFEFTAADSASGISALTCSLDNSAYSPCASPKTFSGLVKGAHSLSIRAVDNAGNQKTIVHSWTVTAGAVDGLALYNANCKACHGNLASSTKLNRSAAAISNAITNVPQMTFLKLTGAEVAAIAEVLKTESQVPTVMTCDANSPRGISKEAVRRLTRDELQATTNALFPGIANDLKSYFENYPDSDIVEEVEKYDPLYSAAQVNQWAEIVDVAVNLLVQRGQLGAIDSCLNSSAISESCWRSVFAKFGSRAYRRPLLANEVNKLTSIALAQANAADAIYVAMHALLRSPAYLFHFEIGISEDATRMRLSDFEVANRISFAILGTPPDDALWSAAERGELKTITQVQAHVARLVDTDGAKTKLKKFFSEWLQLSHVQTPQNEYMVFFRELGGAAGVDEMMRQEIQDYLFYIFWKKKGTFDDLMTQPIAFPRFQGLFYSKDSKPFSALADIYGNDPFSNFTPERQVEATPFPAPNNPGLLTRAGFMASTRWQSQPITRGVFVQRRILCETLPSPDFSVVNQRLADVGSLDPLKLANHQITTTQTAGASCVSCHSKINPTGYALEAYDMIGKFRPREEVLDITKFYSEKKGVMATHALPYPLANVPLGDKAANVSHPLDLARAVAGSERAKQCLSRFVLRHFDRRPDNEGDRCAIQDATDPLVKDQPVLNVFIKSLANEDIFWRRK